MEWHKLPKYNGIQVSQLIFIYILRETVNVYSNGKGVLRHKKTFLLRVKRKSQEIARYLLSWKIVLINVTYQSVHFFSFSLYTRLEHKNYIPMRQTGEDAMHTTFFCHSNSKYIYSSYFPCIVRAQKEPSDTRIIVFTLSFIFKEGRLNMYLKETSKRIF